MIHDLEQGTPDAALKADVLIVGAGAAGIVLAVELARAGKNVTLLEGGGATIEAASQEPYASETVGQRHAGIHGGRFRAQGGTTTKWGGQILEYDAGDFVAKPWVAGSGWPFAKSELTPFYRQALALEGLGAVEREDAAVWRGIGLPQPQFEGLDSYFSRWCPEPNFARLHAAELTGNPRIALWLHANVVGLQLAGEQAVAVEARTLAGRAATFRAAEYIFALGAIESTRFFLQPRAGALPWNASGLLGRHFQDHVDSNAATVVPHDRRALSRCFDNVFTGGYKYHPKVRLTPEIQRQRETLNVSATMLFVSDLDETLAAVKGTAKNLLRGRVTEVRAGDLLRMAANLPLLAQQSFRYAVRHRAFNPADAAIRLRVHCEQEPLGQSTISLAETRDALGLLRTRLEWRIAPREVETIRVFVETAQRALAPLAEIVPDPDLVAGDPAYLERADDSNHHMGGMRMGATATAGVVDPDLRLWGTRNVFVCSSAVYPTSGHSNPTHTLLALAVRLAEHLNR